MGNDDYYRPDDEQEEAQSRIDRIRGGGSQAPEPAPEPRGRARVDDDYDQRERQRSRPQRERRRNDESPPEPQLTRSQGQQAVLLIGGVVLLGLLAVVVIVLLAGGLGGDGGGGGINLPFGATDTPTSAPSPTPTEVPTATPTETPTPTPPDLALPPLTCLFQSGVGCFDYCNDAANAAECTAASEFLQAQSVDSAVFFDCLSPGPGANQGNPQKCLADGWFAANP